MQTSRKDKLALRHQLENERASFLSHWRTLGEFIFPRRPRFTLSDANRGDRRNQNIVDSTATLAARTLRSGMMSGITSPARPWFRLSTPDPEIAEYGPVKEWLYLTSQRMATIFLRSNLYNALPVIYGDLGVFGTAAMLVEEDFDAVIRCYPIPIGSYCLANSDRLRIEVFTRDFRMTVRQLVQKFGRKQFEKEIDWNRFSTHVKRSYDEGNLEMWVDVVHEIKPNDQYSPDKIDSKFKKYSSCYYEKGTVGNQTYHVEPERYLREAGYDFFPVLAPRWEVTGEDVYGTNCPGMEALGDIKQLQMGERRTMQAIEKMINPPMTGPSSLRAQKASILPGDITYVDSQTNNGFRPAHEVDPKLREMAEKQQQVRERISRVFYEDLFLMMSQTDRRDITAREIDERHEEKLLALGPVLEQLNQDLLDPLIDVTFDVMNRQGLIPPPPDELQGMKLKVEYISVMAQAQKLVGISGVERLASFWTQLIPVVPEAVDKIDADQMLDVYGDMASTPPGIIRADDKVAEIRAARSQAVKAQQTAEVVAQGAQAAKNLSQADMGGDNALTQLLNSGAGAPN